MTAEELIRKHLAAEVTPDIHGNEYCFDDWMNEAMDEFRGSGQRTALDAPWSRHYECEILARVIDGCPKGQAVAWPFWYGGGKHGEPEAIDWIEDAVFVAVREETRVVRVYENIDASA